MANRFVFSEGALTLNDEQAAIVRQSPTQAMRILASAGSGKTTTLTARIAHLLTHCGSKPNEILLLTFTHNAADVMRSRLQALVGAQPILCGTFHALSQQILRVQSPNSLQDMYHVDELPLKALDFLETAAGTTWSAGIKWLFIDEYQDINEVQDRFIKAFTKATVTIVGDDAQNIYSWRGSCVDFILNFHTRYADVADFQLATNYRSSQAIIAVANSIMRFIPTLDHKELMLAAPTASQGDRPEVRYFARTAEERDWVAEAAIEALGKGSVVILSKFNSVLYAYEAALLKLGIRVRFVEGEHQESQAGTVFLSTFHGAKGLEWDHVFLVRMNDEVFPQQKDEDGVLQERRLFYVAVTRARKFLSFTYSRNERSLSRFVRQIHRPLLVWKTLPRYELSTLTSTIEPTSVGDWVQRLTGEDFRTIKQLRLLPSIPLASPAEPSLWITPYWWVEQGMTREFFDFIRAYWFREVAILRPESGGQWDREAQRLIWTVKIAAEDAVFFEAHRPLFEDLADRFFGLTPRGSPPPQIYYVEVLAAIPKPHTFTQADLIRIIQIVHKMRTVLYNLRFAAVALSDMQFAPIRHAPPQESRCQLIEAWRTYTDLKEPTALLPTYLVGLCRALGEGRSGVLASLPGEREWARSRDFLAGLKARVAAETRGKTVLCRIQTEITDGVTTETDMLIGTTAWFFVEGDQPSELQRLDRVVTVLLTVHALRNASYTVDHVCLFQMITGITHTWPVTTWNPSQSHLLSAFIQARAAFIEP